MIVFPLKCYRDAEACRRYWVATGRTAGSFTETEVAHALQTAWTDFEIGLGLNNLAESSAHGTLATWCFDRSWNLLNHRRKQRHILPVAMLKSWREMVRPLPHRGSDEAPPDSGPTRG